MKRERKKMLVSYSVVTVMLLATVFTGQFGVGAPRSRESAYGALPTVLAISPADEDIATNETVITLFNIDMDKQSAENSFNITPYVSGTFSWVNTSMVFTPSGSLSNSTTYAITIDSDTAVTPSDMALDGNGNNVSEGSPDDDVVWNFTTDDTWLAGDPLPSDTNPWNQFHLDESKSGDYSEDVKFVDGEYNYDSGKRVDSSPIVRNGLVFYGDNDGWAQVLEETTMEEKCKAKLGNTAARPTMASDGDYFWAATEGDSSKSPVFQRVLIDNCQKVGKPWRFKNGRIHAPLAFVPEHRVGYQELEDRVYVIVDYPNANPDRSVVLAFNSNNEFRWTYSLDGDRHVKTSGIVAPSPRPYSFAWRLFFGDTGGMVYSVSENYGVDGKADTYQITDQENPDPAIYSTPTSINNFAYVAAGNKIYEFDALRPDAGGPFQPIRGSPVLEGTIVSSPAIHNHYLYVATHNKNQLNPVVYFYQLKVFHGAEPIEIKYERPYPTGWNDATIGENFYPSPAISSSTAFFLVPEDSTEDHGIYYEFTNDDDFDEQKIWSLPSGTFFTSSSVGLHYWDDHGRIFVGTDGGVEGIYQFTDET